MVLGSAWGHMFSTLALLALWAAGFRSGWIIVLAPVLVIPGRLLVRPFAGTSRCPVQESDLLR